MGASTINRKQLNRIMGRALERLLRSLPEEVSNDLKELFQLFAVAKSEGDVEHMDTIAQAIREILCPDSLKIDLQEDESFEDDALVRSKVQRYRACVGSAIRSRREQLEMTQQDLAEKARIPQSHVSRLEAGKHVPTHLTLRRVAKALKTRPSRLDPGFSDD